MLYRRADGRLARGHTITVYSSDFGTENCVASVAGGCQQFVPARTSRRLVLATCTQQQPFTIVQHPNEFRHLSVWPLELFEVPVEIVSLCLPCSSCRYLFPSVVCFSRFVDTRHYGKR